MLGIEEEDGEDESLGSGIFWVEVWRVRVLGWTRGVGDWNEIPGLSTHYLCNSDIGELVTWKAAFKRRISSFSFRTLSTLSRSFRSFAALASISRSRTPWTLLLSLSKTRHRSQQSIPSSTRSKYRSASEDLYKALLDFGLMRSAFEQSFRTVP